MMDFILHGLPDEAFQWLAIPISSHRDIPVRAANLHAATEFHGALVDLLPRIEIKGPLALVE